MAGVCWVVWLFGVFVTVITLIVNQSNKIETQRLRIEFLESVSRDHGLQIKDMVNKTNAEYKEINNQLSDLKVLLQNKEDRGLKK